MSALSVNNLNYNSTPSAPNAFGTPVKTPIRVFPTTPLSPPPSLQGRVQPAVERALSFDFSPVQMRTPPAAVVVEDDSPSSDDTDFSFLMEGASAAPAQPAAEAQEVLPPIIETTLALHDGSALQIGEMTYTLSKGPKGTYMQLFMAEESDSFVVKAFLLEHLRTRGPQNAQGLTNWLTHSVGQYLKCLELGIPVAAIQNDPVAEGFMVMDFVPGSLDADFAAWGCKAEAAPKRIQDLPQAVFAHLEQVVNIVAKGAAATSQGLFIDAEPSNFRVTAGNTVVLVDHREEALEADEPFSAELRRCIDRLSAGNPHVRALFLSAIEQRAPSIHREIIALDRE